MKKVERAELLGLGEYEGIRDHFRARIIEMKRNRRVPVGPHMTFIFENHDTVLLQIQEMLRTERISQEKAIAHEIATYNELVPGEGELSATLMIEHTDKDERAKALAELHDLGEHVVLRIGDHAAKARFQKQDGEEEGRLPAVNYLLFDVGREAKAALEDGATEAILEITHPRYPHATKLSAETRGELADDLDG
jgi:hypothetical protein